MDGDEHPSRLEQLVDRGSLEAVVYTLKLYMLADQCVCETAPCPEDCEMCMYCCGTTALKGIGEEP